jgi:hypothetical protein
MIMTHLKKGVLVLLALVGGLFLTALYQELGYRKASTYCSTTLGESTAIRNVSYGEMQATRSAICKSAFFCKEEKYSASILDCGFGNNCDEPTEYTRCTTRLPDLSSFSL